MLLPFDGLPVPDLNTYKPRPLQPKSCSEESDWSSSKSSSSDESYQETRQQVKQNTQPPYVIPQRRGKQITGRIGDIWRMAEMYKSNAVLGCEGVVETDAFQTGFRLAKDVFLSRFMSLPVILKMQYTSDT